MIVYLVIFIFGLTVGSFLNCVIHRLEKEESFVSGRSACPYCQHQLAWYDLIPVLSFIILRGKCRYCQQKISLQYPLVELFTGILFVLILNFELRIIAGDTSPDIDILSVPLTMNYEFFRLFFILDSLFLTLISSLLVIIFIYDLKHFIILDKVVYPAILVSGIWYFVSSIFFNVYTRYEILNTIYSAFGAAIFFLLIILASRGKWMGVGDIKLAFLMGLILGFPNILVALFLAFFLGAIIGIGLILFGKKTLKSEIPFGPFLITGTFIALFWGNQTVNWYLNFFT